MKYLDSGKNKKHLIAQYLNDLKSPNSEKIGKALLNLFLADYPKIEEQAKKLVNNESNFVKFACIYILAMKGNFDYLIKLTDFIKDESDYIRKIAVNGINSLFQEKIIIYDYIQMEELNNEYPKIKEKIISLKNKVKWNDEKNIYL